MRTTLTLDPDVAAMLAEYRKCHDLGLKEAVNEALRNGLQAAQRSSAKRKPFKTIGIDHGRTLVPNVDDIGALLETVDEKPLR